MDGNNVPRKSERTNKGVPSTRFGFENYEVEDRAFGDANIPIMQNQPDKGAIGSMDRTTNATTIIKPQNSTKSVLSKAASKTSRRSIREVQHLQGIIEIEAELHEIEMLELKRKKEFLRRSQQLKNEMKEKEDVLSNATDHQEDIVIPELCNEERNRNISEWMNKIEDPRQFNDCRQPPDLENAMHHRRNHGALESTRLNYGAELDQAQEAQSEILIAAFKALQSKECKDLLKFNGENVLEWPNFISEFRRSTEEYDIKPNKNLRRLNKALEGDARSSIQTLLTSPDNIHKIISHLEMCFGRKEWILQHLISDLRSFPTMDEEEDIHQFKEFHSKLFGAITTIKNMEAENYMDNPELLTCLEEKLPLRTKNDWIHYKAKLQRRHANVNIARLGEWFKIELDAQYAGLSAKDVIKKYHKPGSDNNNNNSYIPDGKEFP